VFFCDAEENEQKKAPISVKFEIPYFTVRHSRLPLGMCYWWRESAFLFH
jgi:hypothetical protein